MQRTIALLLTLASCGSTGSPLATDAPVVLWSVAVSEPSAGPIALPGRILLVQQGTLSALDPGTGGILWSVDLGAAGFPVLTAAAGVAYASQDLLAAIRLDDGAVVWSRPNPDVGILVPAGSLLYLIGRGILAFDAATGEFLWQAVASSIFGQIAVGGGLICLAGEAVECHDGAEGRLLWSASPPGDARVIDLDVGAGRVVASTTRGDVVAYDPRTGTVVWSRNIGTPLQATTVTGLRVTSCRGGPGPDDRGQCVAMEEANGSVRWVLAVRGPTSAPLVRDGRMIVVDARAIHVVDVATGRLVRRMALPGEGPFHEARLAYSGGVLYANFRGALLALRIQ